MDSLKIWPLALQVVLVELEEITPDQLALFPESVRHLRKKQGAVCWWKNATTRQRWRTCSRTAEDKETGGQDAQLSQSLSPSSRFWKEMRYYMPVRGKRVVYPEKTALLNVWRGLDMNVSADEQERSWAPMHMCMVVNKFRNTVLSPEAVRQSPWLQHVQHVLPEADREKVEDTLTRLIHHSTAQTCSATTSVLSRVRLHSHLNCWPAGGDWRLTMMKKRSNVNRKLTVYICKKISINFSVIRS